MSFPVGILHRDWLKDANFTGYSTIHGRKVLGYTKLDFIDYWADAEDCTPVRWTFHAGPGRFDTVGYYEDEEVPDESFFKPPSYCPHHSQEHVVDGVGASAASGSATDSEPLVEDSISLVV